MSFTLLSEKAFVIVGLVSLRYACVEWRGIGFQERHPEQNV